VNPEELDALDARALRVGLALTYVDAFGYERPVTAETKAALVEALEPRMPADDARITPVCMVVRADASLVVPLRLPHPAPPAVVHAMLRREDGSTTLAEIAIDESRLFWPEMPPLGYHVLELRLETDGLTILEDVHIVVVPPQAYLPPGFDRDQRAWGFTLQLYSLRSERNWGIGDFTDLRAVVGIAADAGADVIGLNPLHALHATDTEAASPYSPTSRRFLETRYIDVEAIPEYRESEEARSLVASPAFQDELARLRATSHVDYAGAARAKDAVLAILARHFLATHHRKHTPRDRAFRAWTEAGGKALRLFAIYEALTAHFAEDEGRLRGWLTWPREYRDPNGTAVATFVAEHEPAILARLYIQWTAEQQLGHAAALAKERMRIGLYCDLAVGVDANSADVWGDSGAFVLGASAGAPPDIMNVHGQDWGLPPFDPHALRARGYAPFAQMIRANMRGVGALRLDHVMALMRLYLVPHGAKPTDGAYLRYPLDEMIGVLALESQRAGAMVIGEDLGTVPAGFRERMAEAAVLSYRLLLFERAPDGGFFGPEMYPRQALATASTHDLPTLVGWFCGRDIDLRERLGLADATTAAIEREGRFAERARLLDSLVGNGVLTREAAEALPARADTTDEALAFAETIAAAYEYLARTPAALVIVQLDDALCEVDQLNLPGTDRAYANWRRKLRVPIEGLVRDAGFRRVVARMDIARIT
jgi:(1->4)-alpha-D-glucan 1-alpha-D-glucosylmutase